MKSFKGPVVVGGGAAGLAACLTLEAAGYRPTLLEAGEALGGRLATEQLPDGTPIDRGFQVLQSAYPELKRWVDFDALDCIAFVPGARVHSKGRWRTMADPRRAPGLLFATVFSGIGSWSDRIKVLRLVLALRRTDSDNVQQGNFGADHNQAHPWSHRSTAEFFESWGFSPAFIRGFLGPFFAGIFLEGALETPAAQFQYTFKMLSEGPVLKPRHGMADLVAHLRGQLKQTDIHTGCRVSAVSAKALQVDGADRPIESGAIVTVPGLHPGFVVKEWNACLNLVFHTDAVPFGRPLIGLLPAAQCVTNFHFMADVEGEVGKRRINVTALPEPGAQQEETVRRVRSELGAAGIECGELLWSASIDQALPRLKPVGQGAMPPNIEGVYFAGDGAFAPSLDGALRAGRMAAESWMEEQTVPVESEP